MDALAAVEFSVMALDHRGQVAQHTVLAANMEQARQLASSQGLTVLSCTASADGRSSEGFLRRIGLARPAAVDTVTFAQDLATLMEAGLTVKESVATLARKETSSARKQVMTRLNDAIGEGLRFSAALEQLAVFPPLLIATVAASEETGDLAIGLSRYARHQSNLRSVRDRVVGACVYPLLLLGVGSCVILVLLGIVVPRFSRLIEANGKELPALSQGLMAWGRFADTHPLAPVVMVTAFVAAMLYLAMQWRSPQARRRWLSRVPGVAAVVREFQHLQMYRTAAILTSRGIPIHRALTLTFDLLAPADQERLARGIAQMKQGVSISAAMAACGVSDVVAQSMLTVAERSGALSEMLDRIADYYDRSLQRRIDLTTRLVEPLLMIVFGAVIGGIVVLMYLPIFDLASSVG